MAIITLTTDFGTSDGYVGALKGVIASRAPSVTVVDIAHDIPPGDIAHAAWVVWTSTPLFPADTIHLVVVDPGVGSARNPVALQVRTKDGFHRYVGPDNGVFGYLNATEGHVIDNPAVIGYVASATFHGRDIFAPAAAALATDYQPYQLGPSVPLAGALPWGRRERGAGRVVHVDRYGNLLSDLPAGEARSAVEIGGTRLPLARTYSDVASGELVAYIGSMRTVEIAVRDGRADERLRVRRGERVAPAAPDAGPYR